MNSREQLRKHAEADKQQGIALAVDAKPDKVAAGKAALLLTPKQAAEALAISPRKLWGMTASGEISHLRIGRAVRYPLDDLQRWIDDQKKGGAA